MDVLFRFVLFYYTFDFVFNSTFTSLKFCTLSEFTNYFQIHRTINVFKWPRNISNYPCLLFFSVNDLCRASIFIMLSSFWCIISIMDNTVLEVFGQRQSTNKLYYIFFNGIFWLIKIHLVFEISIVFTMQAFKSNFLPIITHGCYLMPSGFAKWKKENLFVLYYFAYQTGIVQIYSHLVSYCSCQAIW